MQLKITHYQKLSILFLNLRDQILVGHSNLGRSRVVSDLLEAHFTVHFDKHDFASYGKYNVEGTILGSIPVKGSGQFNVTNKDANLLGYVKFSDFGITSDGYIDISVGEVRQYVIWLNNPKPTFDGLVAGGYEANIIESMTKKYEDSDTINQWLPIGEYLKRYFEEVFAETPLSEIIGTTLGPPTTPTTTEDPCKWCGCTAEKKSAVDTTTHSEQILESKVITDGNGRKIQITRKIVELTVAEVIE